MGSDVQLGLSETAKRSLDPQTDKRAEAIMGKFARAFHSCQEPNCVLPADYFVEGETYCAACAGKHALIILQMEVRS